MKKHLTALLLILMFVGFYIFYLMINKTKTVLSVVTPDKIKLSSQNLKYDTDNSVCIDEIDAFSLKSDDETVEKICKELNITKSDFISMGYLAQEYAVKTLLNKKVSVKYTGKISPECKYANIKLNGLNYDEMLLNKGFALKNGKIADKKNFENNLNNARKLDLVILNHHSGKYHTLDCPYGNIAHDKVVIPKKQLPSNVKPCKFCHNSRYGNIKRVNFRKGIDIFEIPKLIQPPLIVSDGYLKVINTDYTRNLIPNNRCETNVCKEFVKLVDNSNETIDIAIYGYDDIPMITNALKRAKERGVKIRFVYDENYDSSKTYYKDNHIISKIAFESKNDKTDSKTQSNMLMHNKFVIFDKNTVYTGSMNFSKAGLSGYDVNNIIIIQSKDVASLYTAEFEQMVSGKFHQSKNKLNINNRFKIGNSEVEVYFSPKDKSSLRIVQLINNAKSYIYIPAFLITHKDIMQALITAKSKGIDVRVIIDANSVSTRNTKHALLRQNNIMLKTENYAGKLHSKSIIIDDEYLITGSMNFSNSGENKNDENLLIIKNSTIVKSYKKFFLYLWTMIPDKYLKRNAKPESFESIGSCSDGVDNNFNGKIDMEEEFCRQ